jgi:septal ring factor EnvC (AmiA/AmiB activator)
MLAVLGLVGVLLNGVVVVAVAAWISTRAKRTEAQVDNEKAAAAARLKLDDKREDELAVVRREYREDVRALKEEIRKLQDRLDEKDEQIDKLQDERRDLIVKVADLSREVGSLRAELGRHPC